jgi:hypothetical protein
VDRRATCARRSRAPRLATAAGEALPFERADLRRIPLARLLVKHSFMHDTAGELRRTVTDAARELARLSEAESARRPAPGKWSRKEIIGHLVDSAANNHQRFVRAQMQDDLVFAGYAQDAWVRVQEYQSSNWLDLVELWRTYNLHIAHVMENTPERALKTPRARHSLHEIAWRTVPAEEPATLEYFMRDYVDHLRHHLEQALPR